MSKIDKSYINEKALIARIKNLYSQFQFDQESLTNLSKSTCSSSTKNYLKNHHL